MRVTEVAVLTHGHCFDGLCSAVMFTRLLRHIRGPAVQFRYVACGYTSNQTPLASLLRGDENAILDYRFVNDARLGWYFDHHRTAFSSPEDRSYFDDQQAKLPYYYDGSYSSCTQLVSDVARDKYGLVDEKLKSLTEWADKIDSASFESAEAALDYSQPVMQLARVVEHHGDSAFFAELVPELLNRPLEDVARLAKHQKRYRKIQSHAEAFADRVRKSARTLDRVVFVDLSDAEVESFGKFVTYALYPKAMYSVLLGRFKTGARISVGYNPWSDRKLDRDLSSICVRYGGGGHPFVGGISFPASDIPRAQRVAQAIALELAEQAA
jgi:hypothetical protein